MLSHAHEEALDLLPPGTLAVDCLHWTSPAHAWGMEVQGCRVWRRLKAHDCGR